MSGTILVVDDSKTDLVLIKSSLEKEDPTLKILAAESGEEGLKAVENNNDIALVILDIRMPGMDGFETCAKMKQVRPDIKVLILTGIEDPLDIKKASSAGVDLFTTKNLLEYTLYKAAVKLLET